MLNQTISGSIGQYLVNDTGLVRLDEERSKAQRYFLAEHSERHEPSNNTYLVHNQ